MNITKEMIDKAKQVELKDLEPTLRSIIQIAMHVRDNSGEFEDFVNPPKRYLAAWIYRCNACNCEIHHACPYSKH
ncbi:hypothetical protein [Polynucleobacter sphagniphilus]|uniref:hypothetical protein n=1 Tax=Polynucleobacter sphagniphilus TaxID=1743169 RepID=UPI00247688E6|nr:hypothetical protein [Polynucleobacter sphagniphilus]MDH6524552.1 hypothetical protein [Polynucleobacter sphagniphilus]